MNFLDKAKKKQAELKAQLEKATKDISNFNIGDTFGSSSSKDSKPKPAPENADAIKAPVELDSTAISRPVAELDNTQSTPTTAPVMTPTTTATPLSVLTPAVEPEPANAVQAEPAIAAKSETAPADHASAISTAGPPRNPVKLSLAQRKDVRDVWENSGKVRLEAKLLALLGVPWTLDADAGTLLNIRGDGVAADVANPGAMIEDYMSSAVRGIDDQVSYYKGSTADDINTLAYRHILSLEIDTEVTKEVDNPRDYNRCDFRDGRLRVLIHREHLRSNTVNATARLQEVILESRTNSGQLKNKIDYITNHSIRINWEKQVTRILEEARELLDNEDFQFDPRFQEVWQALSDYSKTKPGKKQFNNMSWQLGLADNMFGSFNEFVVELRRQKFDEDELLQETFKEAVTKNVLAFRIVEQTTLRHEMALEDGVLWMQCKPEDYYRGGNAYTEEMMTLF